MEMKAKASHSTQLDSLYFLQFIHHMIAVSSVLNIYCQKLESKTRISGRYAPLILVARFARTKVADYLK